MNFKKIQPMMLAHLGAQDDMINMLFFFKVTPCIRPNNIHDHTNKGTFTPSVHARKV